MRERWSVKQADQYGLGSYVLGLLDRCGKERATPQDMACPIAGEVVVPGILSKTRTPSTESVALVEVSLFLSAIGSIGHTVNLLSCP